MDPTERESPASDADLWATGEADNAGLWGSPIGPARPVAPQRPPEAGVPPPRQDEPEEEVSPEEAVRRGVDRLRRALVRAERTCRDAGMFAEDLAVDVRDDTTWGEGSVVLRSLFELADMLEQDVAGRLADARRHVRRGHTSLVLPTLRAAERAARGAVIAARDVADDLARAPAADRALAEAAADLRTFVSDELGERLRILRRTLEGR